MDYKSKVSKSDVTVEGVKTIDGSEVEFQGNAMFIEPGMAFDTWVEMTSHLVVNDTESKFRIGDALNYGEVEFGEDYYQFFSYVDYEEGTLRNYAWIARKIPPVQRHNGLIWSHFVELASVKDQEERENLIDQILDGEIQTVQDLKDKKNGIEPSSAQKMDTVCCEACYGSGRLTEPEGSELNEKIKKLRGEDTQYPPSPPKVYEDMLG